MMTAGMDDGSEQETATMQEQVVLCKEYAQNAHLWL